MIELHQTDKLENTRPWTKIINSKTTFKAPLVKQQFKTLYRWNFLTNYRTKLFKQANS